MHTILIVSVNDLISHYQWRCFKLLNISILLSADEPTYMFIKYQTYFFHSVIKTPSAFWHHVSLIISIMFFSYIIKWKEHVTIWKCHCRFFLLLFFLKNRDMCIIKHFWYFHVALKICYYIKTWITIEKL